MKKNKEQILECIADLGVDISNLLASGMGTIKDQTSSEYTAQLMHDQNISNAYTLIRSKISEIYLILKATEIEYYKALHIAYREGSWYDYSQKEVKTLIDAAQKYYDLCTDIS